MERISCDHALIALRVKAVEDGSGAFCGDPSLQLSAAESRLIGIKPVICAKTAVAALDAIVMQGEGAAADAEQSHFRLFVDLRTELRALRAADPSFSSAYPAAVNPVLRRPLRPEGRVWIEDETAAALVDTANTAYMLMLRLLAYSYCCRDRWPNRPRSGARHDG
ncbi:MAG TPA: ferritin-like domain-containing protein [Polyangiales bacterium]|nr:ferritin-like domain-containing protein [Polyangiales bacterium]